MKELSGLGMPAYKKRKMQKNNLKNKIQEIEKEIARWKTNKQRLLDYVNYYNKKLSDGGISKDEYNSIIRSTLKDKTFGYWLKTHDDYINKYNEQKRHYTEEIARIRHIELDSALAVLIIILFSVIIFINKPEFIGRVAFEENLVTENISLIANESINHTIVLKGNLTSIRLTGSITGNGSVKIFLDKTLLLDSSKLKKESGLFSITANAVEEISIPKQENITEKINQSNGLTGQINLSEINNLGVNLTVNQNNGTENASAEINLSENTDEFNITADEPLIENITHEINLTSILSEENITENRTTFSENITEKLNITEDNATSENISKEIVDEEIINQENITQENISEEVIETPVLTEFNNYCLDTCFFDNFPNKIVLRIEIQNATLNLTSVVYTYIEEINQSPEDVTNLSLVNITDINLINKTNITAGIYENITRAEFNQGYVEINKPVKWSSKINASSMNKIELPSQIYNLSLDKYEEKAAVLSDNANFSLEEFNLIGLNKRKEKLIKDLEDIQTSTNKNEINNIFEKISSISEELKAINIPEDIPETEINGNIILSLENISGIVEISYYTPGPQLTEEIINDYKKIVTISSDLHYENVLTYAYIIEAEISSIQVYWLVNNSKIRVHDLNYIDTNNNGLVDKLEWFVPHLSNQSYEIDIVVINVREYVRDNENWTVLFNTTGIANLTISSPNANWTEFLNDSNETSDEMLFMDLKCGDSSLKNNLKLIGFNNITYNYTEIDEEDSVDIEKLFIEDYSCDNETGYLTNFMYRAGYAELLFEFGNATAYAYDANDFYCGVKDPGDSIVGQTIDDLDTDGSSSSCEFEWEISCDGQTGWFYSYTYSTVAEGGTGSHYSSGSPLTKNIWYCIATGSGTCTNGTGCQHGYCIEGTCTAGCEAGYTGQRCSDDQYAYTASQSGVCARNSGAAWYCDKNEVALCAGTTHYTDCDQCSGDGEGCDSDVDPSYSRTGYCLSGTCVPDNSLSEGASCSNNTQCSDTTYTRSCYSGYTAYCQGTSGSTAGQCRRDDGQDCTTGNQCGSGVCYGGSCLAASGTACAATTCGNACSANATAYTDNIQQMGGDYNNGCTPNMPMTAYTASFGSCTSTGSGDNRDADCQANCDTGLTYTDTSGGGYPYQYGRCINLISFGNQCCQAHGGGTGGYNGGDCNTNLNCTDGYCLYVNGQECDQGTDCSSGLCIEGTCRASCSAYYGEPCSNNSEHYAQNGICRYDSTESWHCDAYGDIIPPESPWLAPYERDLVLYWNFDDNSTSRAYDQSAYSNDGANKDVEWTTSGYRGGGMYFDNTSNKYVQVQNKGSVQVTGAMTVSAWVYPTLMPQGTGAMIVTTYDYDSIIANTRGVYFGGGYGTNDNFVFSVYNSTGNVSVIYEPGFFAANINKWTHVVGVFNPGNYLRFYIDGVLAGEDTSDVPDHIAYSSVPLRIGLRADNTVQGMWNGTIDEVKIYSRALTEAEISDEYNKSVHNYTENYIDLSWTDRDSDDGLVLYMPLEEGTGTRTDDLSRMKNDGTITGTEWTSGKYGSALDFDGSSDFVDAGSDSSYDITSDYTFAAWIYPKNIATAGQRIIVKDNNTDGKALSLGDPGSGRIRFFDRGMSPVSTDTGAIISNNNWYHVVAVYDSSDAMKRIYIDGIEVANSTSVTGTPATNSVNLGIGADPKGNSGGFFNGTIDEVRIYNRSLTTEEIIDLMESGLIDKGLYRANTSTGTYKPVGGIYDDFEDGDSNGWTEDSGTWTVESFEGDYIYNQSSDSAPVETTYSNSLTNYIYEADIYADSASSASTSHPGLIFNAVDGDNYDVCYFRPHSSGAYDAVACRPVTSDSLGAESSSGAIIPWDTWFHVKLIHRGNSVKVFVDDILSQEYTAIKAGTNIGLFEHDGIGYFDNIKITHLKSDNNYTDPDALDTQKPAEATGLSSSSHTASYWDSDNTVDFSWTRATDTGDDYYYYIKSYDDSGNENDFVLENNGFENYTDGFSPGWDSSLNGDLRPITGSWSYGYNGGVSEPDIGYHAHIVDDPDCKGVACFKFIDMNTVYGYPHRWLGTASTLTNVLEDDDYKPGDMLRVSMDIKVNTTGKYVRYGLYHREGGALTFGSLTVDKYASEADQWENVEHVFTLYSAINYSSYMTLYIYGQNGDEGVLWVDNVHIDKVRNESAISGLDGYDTACDTSSGDLSTTSKDYEESQTTQTCSFSDGSSNYFHVKSVDEAGNWDDTSADLGPYWICADADGIVDSDNDGLSLTDSGDTCGCSATDAQTPDDCDPGVDGTSNGVCVQVNDAATYDCDYDGSEVCYGGTYYENDCQYCPEKNTCDSDGGTAYSADGICLTDTNNCCNDWSSGPSDDPDQCGTEAEVCDADNGDYCDDVSDASWDAGTTSGTDEYRCDQSDSACRLCYANNTEENHPSSSGADGTCESGCGASANCDEQDAQDYCPTSGTWCNSTCIEVDRDSSEAACIDSGGNCDTYYWNSGGSACCGDDGAATEDWDDGDNDGATQCCLNGELVNNNTIVNDNYYCYNDGSGADIYRCGGSDSTGSVDTEASDEQLVGIRYCDLPNGKWLSVIHDPPYITPNPAYETNNLTCNYNNTRNTLERDVVNITNWYINNKSIMVLYMPFEGGSNSTYTKDYSGYGNDGVVSGATWNRTGGKIGGAYEFDGSDDYIELAQPSALNILGRPNLTISAWVNSTSLAVYDGIIDNCQGGGATTVRLHFGIGNGGNTLRFLLGDGTSYNDFSSDANSIYLNNTWYHVAVTLDSYNNLKFFINGIQNGTTKILTRDLASSTESWKIGRAFNSSSYSWNGSIDEVRIYNITLSPEQIKANYEAGLAGHTPNVIVSNETNRTETWKCEVTPNDGYEDGNTLNSSEVYILGAASSRKFVIQNSSGDNVASIDENGDMYLIGTVLETQSSLNPPSYSFILQNRTSDVIAYFNSSGSLYLLGSLTQETTPAVSGTSLQIRDPNDNLVAIFDNEGNLELKGMLFENYAIP
ncbi:hypothetical protein JXB41_05295 [Candidatus Woesearchaeota archaeon]|nr:hypothetical protein [Candidatus Woesearchaeota archaeon]